MSRIVATYSIKITLREPEAPIPVEVTKAGGVEPMAPPSVPKAPTLDEIEGWIEMALGSSGFEVNAVGERTDK